MPVIKYRKIMEGVLKKPVFTNRDLVNEGIPRNYAKKMLSLMAKSGRIHHIERGKYTVLDEPLLVAPHICQPCYISIWSALRIRNLTTQLPFGLEIVTTRKRFTRNLTFMGTRINFYTVHPKLMFGYEYIIQDSIRIPVANAEKAVIDAMYLRRMPEEDIVEILPDLDYERLMSYSKRTENKRIIKETERLVKCSRKKR